jgi:Coenzyme Q (ubiquinone) biosynthesis protein Coq4
MKQYIIKIRSSILVLLTHKIALPLLKKVRKATMFNYSELELYMLPAGSLGNDLYHFLEKRNLPLLKHYARHDLKHVLLNYDTTDEGEVCLQSFMLGNGRISFPVLATVVYGFITMPEHWKKMKEAFREGKRCTSFHNWKWNELVQVQTVELRNRIFNQ